MPCMSQQLRGSLVVTSGNELALSCWSARRRTLTPAMNWPPLGGVFR